MKRLIVDMSSIMWTCLLAGTDTEFGFKVDFEGKPFQVNSATYGYENAINHFVAMLDNLNMTPMQMILVIEGLNSKLLRTNVLPGYKGGGKETRPQEAYAEFGKLREMLMTTLTGLGACAVTQDGIEADDVIAYLALNLQGYRIVDSNDGDMAVLINDSGNEDDMIHLYKFGKGLVTENPIGPFPCKHVLTYKSLVGDTSDKIPGAKGFGKTGWMNLIVNFGYEGLDAMLELIQRRKLKELEEDVAQLPALKTIIADEEGVYKCYAVAKLYPEKVNTQRKPLVWTAGMTKPTKDERLKKWGGASRLVYAHNFEQALQWMQSKLDESPFISLDIETSATDDADAWMETAKAKNKDDSDNTNVDVFGAQLTGFSVTFGNNMQYTLYFSVDHVEEPGKLNITKLQAKQAMRALPADKINAIQNTSFELPVLMEELGPLDQDGLPE